jgi:hypothetical protein
VGGATSPLDAAERIAYGVLVAAFEEGLVTTLQHAIRRTQAIQRTCQPLGEQWVNDQEERLR